MKSVPLVLAFTALLAFTTLTTGQEQSGEQAVRRVVADFAGAINSRRRQGLCCIVCGGRRLRRDYRQVLKGPQ